MPKRYKKKTTSGHKLELWFDIPAPIWRQAGGPTYGCRCRHCAWRRRWIKEFKASQWVGNSAEKLRRNVIVLHAIREDLSA